MQENDGPVLEWVRNLAPYAFLLREAGHSAVKKLSLDSKERPRGGRQDTDVRIRGPSSPALFRPTRTSWIWTEYMSVAEDRWSKRIAQLNPD